ncbi:MAG: hypothetical protein NC133_02700 [Prevotella sp.]|nr:hypothetical protein [Prevotella sp.]
MDKRKQNHNNNKSTASDVLTNAGIGLGLATFMLAAAPDNSAAKIHDLTPLQSVAIDAPYTQQALMQGEIDKDYHGFISRYRDVLLHCDDQIKQQMDAVMRERFQCGFAQIWALDELDFSSCLNFLCSKDAAFKSLYQKADQQYTAKVEQAKKAGTAFEYYRPRVRESMTETVVAVDEKNHNETVQQTITDAQGKAVTYEFERER